jgi:hypothetical protein
MRSAVKHGQTHENMIASALKSEGLRRSKFVKQDNKSEGEGGGGVHSFTVKFLITTTPECYSTLHHMY